jgi:hypothetical protein
MQQNAIDGSRAYVTRDAAGANGYTKYLTERFGANTEQHQEWGRNIVTSNGPESGWSATQGPADVNAEIAIIPERGVAAPNPNLVRTPMFAAKKGAAEYLKETGEEPKSSIHPLIQDSFVGRIVPSLGRVDIPDAFVSRPSAATVANVAKIILNDAPRSSLSDGIAAWNAPQTAAQRALHQRIRELYETVSSIPVQPPINAAETTFAAVERNAPLAKQIPDGVQITHFEDGTTEWKVDTTAGITPTQFC